MQKKALPKMQPVPPQHIGKLTEKPLAPITLRELPHWALALFFVYVVASNYDPLWILEPAPGIPVELIEPAPPILKMSAVPAEMILPAAVNDGLCLRPDSSASLDPAIDPSLDPTSC